MNDSIVHGLFALSAAFVAISYQYYQFKMQLRISDENAIRLEKKRVIEAIIASRFAITDSKNQHPEVVARFIVAFGAIPAHFSHNKDCMDKYRSISDNFTAQKFYELVIALMKDVPLETEGLDKHLLENVPIVLLGRVQ